MINPYNEPNCFDVFCTPLKYVLK